MELTDALFPDFAEEFKKDYAELDKNDKDYEKKKKEIE